MRFKPPRPVTREVLLAAALLATVLDARSATEFAADAVYTAVPVEHDARQSASAAAPVPTARLFLSNERMRFESAGVSGLTMIVDDSNHTTVALIPARKSYRPLGSRPSQYFRVSDAENACPDWQASVGKTFKCEKLGSDVVAGRHAVKYRRINPGATVDLVWIDTQLNYVIKWRVGKTEAELRNIKEGPQPAELFAVPQDYEFLGPRVNPAKTAVRR